MEPIKIRKVYFTRELSEFTHFFKTRFYNKIMERVGSAETSGRTSKTKVIEFQQRFKGG